MTNKIIKLKPLIPPMIIARKYSGDLLRLVSEMVKDYWSLVGIYRNKRGQVVQDETWAITDLDDRLAKLDRKWQERFKEYAKNNSPKMIQKVLKQSDIQNNNMQNQAKCRLGDVGFPRLFLSRQAQLNCSNY